jgi:hypothetical protein
MLSSSYTNRIATFQQAMSLFPPKSLKALNIALISMTVLVHLIVPMLRCIFLLNYNLDIKIGKERFCRISLLSMTLICNLYIY